MEPTNIESTNTIPIVLTEKEAAGLLKISRQTLQRIRLRGEISASRVGGGKVVYFPDSLRTYLASRELNPTRFPAQAKTPLQN